MCGINGFIGLGKGESAYTQDRMRQIVHNMNEKIIHRGPDSEGLYADERCSLGMRRLSIIDLDTGAQPIYSCDRTKLIVFNGEIYNYRELKDELTAEGSVFSTRSDTEVVLQGLMKHGRDYIKRLEGMFAFCYYDSTNGSWLLARDRTGEKPLYYYRNDEFLLFGSELKSLISTGLIDKEIDTEALTTYFQLAYIPAPLSILKGVRKMMPATWIHISKDGEITSGRYWKLTFSADEEYSDREWCKKELKKRLMSSVEHRMIADVPLGAFLSGGFDSAIIVGLMSKISDHPVNTFTVGFREKSYDESWLAGIIAKKNGTNHHTMILDWDEAVKDIDEILDNIDEPFADPSLVASYAVAKMTRQYVTVALTGDAGDELFAGYNKYLMSYYADRYKRIPKVLRSGIVEPCVRHLPASTGIYRKANKVIENAQSPVVEQARALMSRAFNERDAGKLLPGVEISKLGFIRDQFEEPKYADDQKRLQYVDFNTVLEGQMLPKVDRASMRASLETRIPMLDPAVVELAFSMPSNFKISRNQRKIILKETFRDILPEELFKAEKHGFDVPVGIWLEGALKKEFDRYSSKKYLEKQGLFSESFVDGLKARPEAGNIDWSTKVWAFFVFQRWYENFIHE